MTTDERPDLGKRLKELRQSRNLSLNDLARQTGLSRSALYKVENNGMSLTYQKLLRLSDGLGVDITQLFRMAPESQAQSPLAAFREVGHPGEGDLVTTPNYDHYYLCNDIVQKGLIPMMGRVKRRSLKEFGEMSSHPGEEFTYVVEGSIEVHTQLYRPVVLQQGDYIYLSSTMPHAYINKGPGEAQILTVCTRPEHPVAQSSDEAAGESARPAVPKIAKQSAAAARPKSRRG
jgi:transcriptional regulator with XRE-family HTH domain